MRKKKLPRNIVELAAPVTYLSESEAAQRLGVDENTLHQWALTWIAAKPENELASRLAKARRRVQLRGQC